MEASRFQANGMVVDIPVPMVQTVLKTVEGLQLQFINVVGEIPVVVQDEFRANANEIQGMNF